MAADEDVTSIPIRLGSLISLELRSADGSLYGGTGFFVHDGSPRMVRAHRAVTITGRALGAAALPIKQEVHVRWTEVGGGAEEAEGGQRRGRLSLRPDDRGAFTILVRPAADDLPRPLGVLEVEIAPVSFEPVTMTISQVETHLGDITFEEARRIKLLIDPRQVPSLGDAWRVEDRQIDFHLPADGHERRTYSASGYGLNNDGTLWLALPAEKVTVGELASTVAIVTMVGTKTDNDRSFFLRRTGDRAYVALPKERQYTIIVQGLGQNLEQNVSLEWWWPAPKSGFGDSIPLSKVANGEPLTFLPMPAGDVWVCWRIGGAEEGRIRLSQPETTITIR